MKQFVITGKVVAVYPNSISLEILSDKCLKVVNFKTEADHDLFSDNLINTFIGLTGNIIPSNIDGTLKLELFVTSVTLDYFVNKDVVHFNNFHFIAFTNESVVTLDNSNVVQIQSSKENSLPINFQPSVHSSLTLNDFNHPISAIIGYIDLDHDGNICLMYEKADCAITNQFIYNESARD